jgi:hypothetical protein
MSAYTKVGRPQRTPLPNCRCGAVIPRKWKNEGAVVCPSCAERLQRELAKQLQEGRVRFGAVAGVA